MSEIENKPSHHYVCLNIENNPDLHITVCTLDKLSSLQLLPVIRGMINYFGVNTSTSSFDAVNYPQTSRGFVKEPRTVVRVCLPHIFQIKCESFRTAFYVNRDGTYDGFTPHITFENKEEAERYINATDFTRVKSISLVNAKSKKRVFTINLGFDTPDWDAELLTLLKSHNDFLY